VNKQFSLKEIDKIIKSCKAKGVLFFKYGELEISFDTPEKLSRTTRTQARVSTKKSGLVEEKANFQAQFDLAKEVAETLHVEDPSLYEAMLIRGELGEEKNN